MRFAVVVKVMISLTPVLVKGSGEIVRGLEESRKLQIRQDDEEREPSLSPNPSSSWNPSRDPYMGHHHHVGPPDKKKKTKKKKGHNYEKQMKKKMKHGGEEKFVPKEWKDSSKERKDGSKEWKDESKERKSGSKESKSMVTGAADKGKGKGKSTGKGKEKDKGKETGKYIEQERPMAKGKGKGKGFLAKDLDFDDKTKCLSPLAMDIRSAVGEVYTMNPEICCEFRGPSAVFVTHSEKDDRTSTGFETFWDNVYFHIERTSLQVGVCFVMTGIDQSVGNRMTQDIMMDILQSVSSLSDVVSMMSTDPSDGANVGNVVRAIYDDPDLPSIGVFNIGYNNIVIESIVTGLERLPYVGVLDDAEFGEKAGEITLELLDGVPAVPLCFNDRMNLAYVGIRCSTFYGTVTNGIIEPAMGVECSPEAELDAVLAQVVDANANAVLSPSQCCSIVASAVEMARLTGKFIIVGCIDEDTTSQDRVNFITSQPIALQAYTASTWVNLPVMISQLGGNGRGRQFFPSPQSLVNAAVYNTIVVVDDE